MVGGGGGGSSEEGINKRTDSSRWRRASTNRKRNTVYSYTIYFFCYYLLFFILRSNHGLFYMFLASMCFPSECIRPFFFYTHRLSFYSSIIFQKHTHQSQSDAARESKTKNSTDDGPTFATIASHWPRIQTRNYILIKIVLFFFFWFFFLCCFFFFHRSFLFIFFRRSKKRQKTNETEINFYHWICVRVKVNNDANIWNAYRNTHESVVHIHKYSGSVIFICSPFSSSASSS